jgi:predicted ABC-type exoprotein transport system permease subunit
VTYVVDALRAFLLSGDYSKLPLDLAVIIAYTAIFVTGSAIMIRRLLE